MSAPSTLARDNGFRQLWAQPRYPAFVLTVSLSRTSAFMFNTAGVLLVLTQTGSAALAGATTAAAVLPGAFTGPVMGAWIDVVRRKRVLMVLDQLVSVVALLAIVALAGHAPGWTVVAASACIGITRPFTSGSFFTAMAEIAGSELLDHASAIEATSQNLAVVLGPALAGVLVGVIGAPATIELQAALTVVVAGLVAVNPALDAASPEAGHTVSHALRTGLRALISERTLLRTTCSSGLAAFGWGLMLVGFPLYAVQTLHSPAHTSGYLWAAVAVGSIAGTFVARRPPSLRRVGGSYAVLGLSALLWPLAGTLTVGIVLIALTGLLEGPAYSGSIALRQRYAPPAVRAQVITTVSSVTGLTIAAGSALGGVLHDTTALIVAFVVINVTAAAVVMSRGRELDSRPLAVPPADQR
jgi:MFS family permease